MVREMGLEPACGKLGIRQTACKRDDYTVFHKIVQAKELVKKQKSEYKWVIKWVTKLSVSCLFFRQYSSGVAASTYFI